MTKVYLFLKKLIALAIIILVFWWLTFLTIPYFYTSPFLVLIFSLICSRILGESPKELFNFQRSEKYFSKGGLRDLIRIPVVLFAFLHDVVVWFLWGVYHIFLMATDFLYFIKILVYKLFYGIIWVLLLLVPFWRIVINFIYYYLIKWPWWIYRYAYKALLKTFNYTILRISFWGSLMALLIFHLFYFVAILLEIRGLAIIGIILSLLPISWIFGEISSVRGQKLLNSPFSDVKLKFRNGIETVRGVLFFLTFFMVLLLAQVGLNLLGWVPKSGIILLGLAININLLINIVLVFLIILIAFGTFVLPTYRLYNDFSETSIKDVAGLTGYIGKRILQYVSGFIPAVFFSILSIIPVSLLIFIALFSTIRVKDNIVSVKTDKLLTKQQNATDAVEEYRIGQQISELKYILNFPEELLQDIEHRPLLKTEIEGKTKKFSEKKAELTTSRENISKQLNTLNKKIEDEGLKTPAVNQTRIDELKDSVNQYNNYLKFSEKNLNLEIQKLSIDVEFARRKFSQLPFIFYLSGLFFAFCSSFVVMFILGYFGNYFYNAFVFQKDNRPAKWKEFIDNEKTLSSRQPLLSATLNIILIITVLIVLFYQRVAMLLI